MPEIAGNLGTVNGKARIDVGFLVHSTSVQPALSPSRKPCTLLTKMPEKVGKQGTVNGKARIEASFPVRWCCVQKRGEVDTAARSSGAGRGAEWFPAGDTLSILFWNVENFFDWKNDSTTVSDGEFSAKGERHWTWKRFQAKANAFAKALFWMEAERGRLPDIVGLEEVENAFVLRQLLQKTALRKLDYKYVHYDSPDRRGIDVALLYRTSRVELLDSKPCHLYDSDSVMTTRDILLCEFRRRTPLRPDHLRDTSSNEIFAVLVNHHPSKYGGTKVSESRRRIAVGRLRFLADSLAAVGVNAVIAGGDFNDTPDKAIFRLLEPILVPMHKELYYRGLGTIKYDGKWDLIDHIYVFPTLVPYARMYIIRIPFLLTRDTAHSGEKPLRTYTGPRYTGGVSDHLPILLEVKFPP